MDTRTLEQHLRETPAGMPPDATASEIPSPSPNGGTIEAPALLFASDEARNFRSRWENIQIGFVDEPRKSVERADELVADTIKRLAEVFATERDELEHEWDKGDQVSTEDLRVALRRYRSFFDRLLKI